LGIIAKIRELGAYRGSASVERGTEERPRCVGVPYADLHGIAHQTAYPSRTRVLPASWSSGSGATRGALRRNFMRAQLPQRWLRLPMRNARQGPSLSCRTTRVLRSNPRLLRSEEHTSELQSLAYLVCRLLLEKKKT